MRCDLCAWMIEATKKNPGILDNMELKPFASPLVTCLSAREPLIREMAEKIVGLIVPVIGMPPFTHILQDCKPDIVKTVKPIIAKYVTLKKPPPPAAPLHNVEKQEKPEDKHKIVATPPPTTHHLVLPTNHHLAPPSVPSSIKSAKAGGGGGIPSLIPKMPATPYNQYEEEKSKT